VCVLAQGPEQRPPIVMHTLPFLSDNAIVNRCDGCALPAALPTRKDMFDLPISKPCPKLTSALTESHM
jgi:hypothetical protein